MEIVVEPWNCPFCGTLETENYYACSVCHKEDGVYHIENMGLKRMSENKNEKLLSAFHKKDRIVLPVLACYTVEQFQKNIMFMMKYTQDKTVDGVWMVSNNSSPDVLGEVIQWLRKEAPEFWVGVNLLHESFDTIIDFLKKYNPDGFWMDHSYITEKNIQTDPVLFIDQLARISWKGLYFGGVLFKYLSVRGDPVKILKNAIPYMDVLCTSGEATGSAISDQKLELVTKTIDRQMPIAIASGITANNVTTLKGKVNIFMFRSAFVNKYEDIQPELFEEIILACSK